MTATTPRPLAVGLEGRLGVLVEGTVTALDDSSVEIAGWKLPIRLGDGVRTVSLVEAVSGSLSECDREHCGTAGCTCDPECFADHCADHDGDEYEVTPASVLRVVADVHDERHTGSFRHCPDPVCAVVQGVEL